MKSPSINGDSVVYQEGDTHHHLADTLESISGSGNRVTSFTTIMVGDRPSIIASHTRSPRQSIIAEGSARELGQSQVKQHYRFTIPPDHPERQFLLSKLREIDGVKFSDTGEIFLTLEPWIVERVRSFVRATGLEDLHRINPVVPGIVLRPDTQTDRRAEMPMNYFSTDTARRVLRIKLAHACGAEVGVLRRAVECGFDISAVTMVPQDPGASHDELILVEEATDSGFGDAQRDILSSSPLVLEIQIEKVRGLIRHVRVHVFDESDARRFARDYSLCLRCNPAAQLDHEEPPFVVSGDLGLTSALEAAGKLVAAGSAVDYTQMNGPLMKRLHPAQPHPQPLSDFAPEVHEEYARLLRADLESLVNEVRQLRKSQRQRV